MSRCHVKCGSLASGSRGLPLGKQLHLGLLLGLHELATSLLRRLGLEGHPDGNIDDVVVRLLQRHLTQPALLLLPTGGFIGGVQGHLLWPLRRRCHLLPPRSASVAATGELGRA